MHLLFLHSSSDLYGASKILLAINELCAKKGYRATVVLSEDGKQRIIADETGSIKEVEMIGLRLAEKMKKGGAEKILAAIRPALPA